MNRFRNLIALFAFSLLILGLPSLASAQWRNNRNDDGYYGNNNNNRNNNNRNLQGTIRSLKNHADEFVRRLDRELDNSRYDGKNREDRINQIAKDFKDATKRLDNAYDNRSDYNNSRDEAQRVLQLGSQLERALSRSRLNRNAGGDWNAIRRDLNVLANAYNSNYNNRGNNRSGDDGYYGNDDDYNRNNGNNRNNRRTNNNNDWRRAIPFPLPF